MHPIIEAGILKTRAEAHRRADPARLARPAGQGAGRRGRCGCCLVFGRGRSASAILCGVNGRWPGWYWLALPGRLG